jgi:hypothetical protein
MKKNKSRTLRQGQRLDTSETKPSSNKERKPPNQSSNTTKSSPAHMQAPPEPKHTPLEPMQQCNPGMQKRAKTCSLCPGRFDRLYRAVRPHAPHLTVWGRLDRPKWPALHQTSQNLPKPIGTPSKHSQVPKACTNFSPLLTMHESNKMRKVSTYSFSNIQNSSQGATQVQTSKLDTLQVRNDLNYMITKFHNQWTRLKRIWVILRKVTLSQAKT